MDPSSYSNTTNANTHNTHNPLTGDGITNTHNPLTGDRTGPNPPRGTNPITGHTEDGNLGRYEQQPVDYAGTGTGVGGGIDPSANGHNTHNPLTGDGVTNTHNPLTGDRTGPYPPQGTNPVSGYTDDGSLGRHEQQPGDYTGTTSTGPHATAYDTSRGVNTTGASGTTGFGTHSASTKTSGSGTKAVLGRVEATLGAMINNSEMYTKGVQKQEEAQAVKRAKEQSMHGGANFRH